MRGNTKNECLKQESAKRETKKKIVEAFWKLYKEMNIERITVKKITDACGIYRTTFYLHFADVYAILEEIEERLMQDVKQIPVGKNLSPDAQEFLRAQIQENLVENYEYLRILLDGVHHPEFAGSYKRELVRRMSAAYGLDLAAMDVCNQKIAEVTFSAMIDMLLRLVDDLDLSYVGAAAILSGYMNYGMVNTIKKASNI